MGNALQGTIAALDKGLIGGNPLESKFAAIDKGITDVQAWKANIDKQRLDLKKTTQKSIREAEKYAAENMPNNETAQSVMVRAMAKFREDAYISEKLVRNGNLPPEENLIFQQNGKQTFEIYSDFIGKQAEQLDLTIERSKGKYITNDKGEQIFVKPTSGELENAMQEIQSQIMTMNGTELGFDDKGMGLVNFHKMEVDPKTNTLVPVVDNEGKPVFIDGESGMSVLSLKIGANTRADRVYITDQVEDFANSAVGTNYEIMVKDGTGLMVGNVLTDSRNNPELKASVNNQVAANTTNVQHATSLFLSENGMGGKAVPFNQYDQLTDAQKKETFTVDILDENLEAKKVTVPKYVRVAPANSNNAIVPEISEEQLEAVRGYNRRSLVAGLQRKITKGTKQSQFDPNSSGASNNKVIKNDKIGRVELSKRMALGGSSQTSALEEMKASGLYTVEKGFNEILSSSKVQELEGELDSKGKPRKGEIYKVQTPRGVEERIVYHTDEDGKQVPLQERTQQTLGLIMTNPTETKDLFNTYIDAGNNFDETYDAGNFLGNTVSTGSQAKLSMDTVVEGTGTKAVTLSNRITDVIKAADDASYTGVDEDLLVKGMKGALNEALNQSNQKIDNLDVSYDGDDITVTGVNSKGKTITITGSQESDDKEEMKLEVNAILNQFFQALNSDKDINAGGAGAGVNYKDK